MELSERMREWTHPTAEYDDDFDKILLKYTDEVALLEEKYHDLLLSVANKHPGETRHETAKRYIVEWEAGTSDAQAEA